MPQHSIRIATCMPLPGDLIAFSGRDLVSDIVNATTWGWPRWSASHVAIVTCHPKHGICLAESTTMATRSCLIRGQRVDGVQFQSIGRRVDEYPGRVWHYPLRIPLARSVASAMNSYLLELAESECAYDLIGAVRSRTMLCAMIQRWKQGREDLHTLFCSELVAAVWNRYDVFETTNASAWNPNTLIRAAVRRDIVLPPYRWK